MSLLDTVLTSWDVRERHSIRIERPAGQVMAAVRDVRVADMPLARALFWLRSVPARLSGRARGALAARPLLSLMQDGGFAVVADDPGQGLVIAVIGQFWNLRGPGARHKVHNGADFIAFAEPGFAKAALSFEVSESEGVTTLATETRVLTTDPVARRRFRRYWRVVGPGSALTRRSLLAAVRRRVLRDSRAPSPLRRG